MPRTTLVQPQAGQHTEREHPVHEGGAWHLRLGYAALVLAVWRVWRGFVGPPDEHFGRFVRTPRATLRYARAWLRRTEPRHLNHNPLGAWMIVALLVAALAAGISGALYDTDRFWGDATVYAWHQWGGWAFALLVPLHLAGVALASIRQHENLVGAMVSGRKRAAGPSDEA
jgi:cytochrome b